jgi:alkylation response protein AidB-like acyl-CoA dehydrogenase
MNPVIKLQTRAPSDDVLAILRREFAATAAEHDEHASFPHHNFTRLAEFGLLTLTTPVDYGGAGGGLREAARVVRAVGAGEASTGLLLAMNYLMHHLLGNSRPAIYQTVARAALDGKGILNALQAEPDLGSAIRGGLPGTVATRLANGSWEISGRKAWATGSPIVNWWLVLARIDEGETPQIGSWLVPGKAQGLTVLPTWNHHGMRATASHELRFEKIIVPAEANLDIFTPGSEKFLQRGARIQIWNGLLLAALYDGIGIAGRDWLHSFLRERVPSNLGKPLATVPRIQAVVGEIESLLLINKTLIDDATYRADMIEALDPTRAQLVKHIVTNNVVRALELALSVTGNHGLDRRNPLERHYRDALCGRVHAPQSDIVLTNAGCNALSEDKV